tara:strand:- start:627 stop:806 length:180 start_codon:yes stop_codon:yes gene_type:complete
MQVLFSKFNDVLAVGVVILIVALWSLQGLGWMVLSGEVVGATIAVFTLIAQFYFRKSPK